jgi:hypothetical protein
MTKGLRKKPDRKWRDPTTGATRNWLEIIGSIAGIPLQPRWSQPEAQAFVRQALGVAVREAIKYQGHRDRDQFEYWEKTSDLSKKAATALQQLIEHASPDGLEYGIKLDDGKYGQYTLRQVGKLPDGRSASAETSKAELALLIEAHKAIKAIIRTAGGYKTRLSQTTSNEREHDKHAFVFRLAEAWVYLTGSVPGLGTERNPFLRFVEAAARDAGIGEQNFWSAAKTAVATLKGIEKLASEGGSDPAKNKRTITFIRDQGPRWLT